MCNLIFNFKIFIFLIITELQYLTDGVLKLWLNFVSNESFLSQADNLVPCIDKVDPK